MPLKMKTSLRPLIQAMLGLGFCASLQAAVTIEPGVVAVGKASQVTLGFEQPEKIASISLQPGSPYLQQRLSLSDKSNSDYQVSRRHNGVYIRDADNKLIAFFDSERPSDSNDHYLFAAADEHGMRVYKDNDWAKKAPVASYRTTGPALDISVDDGLAFIAAGAGGLTVLDVENAKQPLWLGSHQKLGRAIKVSANAAHVAILNDAGIIFLLDAGNPIEPTTISSYRSNETIVDIALHGNQLFALGKTDIQLIDFSAVTPQLSNEGLDFGQGVNLGGERRVFIENKLAYVADWFSGMHIYDLSRPRQPELLSSFHTPGSPKGVVVRDGVAFVADDDHGLQIIDVSDPVKPKLISSLLTQGLAYTPRLVGDLLYLASHRGGFQIIDVSDVSSPKLVSEFDTDGKAWSMEVHGNIAYVADDDSGLLMFDVADPAKPELIGQYFTGGAAEEVTIRDNIAFVAFFDDGLHILDIADPRQPKLISQLTIPGNARGLDLVDDKLYVAGWLSGVHVVDVSNIKRPKLLGSHDTRGASWGLKVIDQYLYAMDWWGGISVIDISDSSKPTAVGGYHNRGQVNHIAAQGNYTFVAQGSNGLQVFDIKNPLNPTWTTGVSFPGQARQVALHEQRAYVAAGDGGMAIIDIGNPFNVRWLGSYDSLGETSAVTADASHAYLIDSREGVVAIDIGNDQARKMARLDIKAHDLWLRDSLLYLATDQGVEVVRLNQDKQLEYVTHFEIEGGAQQITGDSHSVYVSSGKTVHSLKRKLLMQKLGKIEVDAQITDLQANETQLLVSTDTALFSIDNRDVNSPQLTNRYPLLANSSAITFHRDVVYISGEETIIALRPLQNLWQQPQGLAEIQFSLPENLAIGSYNLNINYKDGSQETVNNSISVEMPKFSKPKLNMDDFKKLLEQQKQNSDLFTAPATKD